MLKHRFLHEDWQFAERGWQMPNAKVALSPLEWLPAKVPGHVHIDLVDNGIIGDPFEQKQELGCQWVDEADFSYRTVFSWQPSEGLARRVLRFDGLDTVCTVVLNGREAARHANMFAPLEVDVTQLLVAGSNCLEVHFESAARVGRELRGRFLADNGIAQDVERFDERSFVRKAQYMYGWDWGPRLVSAGIWRPVALLEFDARIRDVAVNQEFEGANVRISVQSKSDAGVMVHVFGEEPPHLGDGLLVTLIDPALWYPNGLGAQPLTRLVSYLCPPDFEISKLPGTAEGACQALDALGFDRRVQQIGIRRVRLLQEPDAYGQSFVFEVNGRPLWAMGANFIPDDSFPARVSAADLRARLEAARDCGMNMLRVWGGGCYESDEFYDLCDELGLLVWQDFPFACGYYPESGGFIESVKDEARANILRLRNRASLAIWCGNNENLQLWQQKWGDKNKHPARYFGEQIYDTVLPDLLAELDPDRPYIPTSPYGGDDCNQGGIGDQHCWDVWHGRGDWTNYRDSSARFSSEYGFASSCSISAWREVFSKRQAGSRDFPMQVGDRIVRDAVVRWHEKTGKGYEDFLSLVALHYPESATLDDWVYYSQLNQRDAIRCAIEHYRRSEFCKGSLIWQLNDCWPVQSWALVDSSGQPKSAWFELSRLHAPRLLSIVREGDRAVAWAVLDNATERWRGAMVLKAVSLVNGATLRSAEVRLAIRPGQRGAVLDLDLNGLDAASTLLVAGAGPVRCHALLGEPKSVLLAPPEQLSISLRGSTLEVETRAPVMDLMLSDAEGTRSFGENCVTLVEPGIVRVRYTGRGCEVYARSLAGQHVVELR